MPEPSVHLHPALVSGVKNARALNPDTPLDEAKEAVLTAALEIGVRVDDSRELAAFAAGLQLGVATALGAVQRSEKLRAGTRSAVMEVIAEGVAPALVGLGEVCGVAWEDGEEPTPDA